VNERAHLRAVAGAPDARRIAAPASRSLGRAARRQRRRRRVAGLLRFGVFLLLIFIAVWAGVRVAHAGEDGAIYTGQHYTVQPGDDLWTIAADEYGARVDLRQAVYVIRTANGMHDSSLQPGESLTLPYLDE
jgi:Tfp pilus assembly protein FimV